VACGSGKGAGAVSARRTGQEGSGEGSRKKKEGKKKRREEKKRRKEKEKRKKWRGRTGEIGKEENINGKNGKGVRKIKRIPWENMGRIFVGVSSFSGVSGIFGTAMMARRTDRQDRGGARFPS
jgi:hypothetical protein